MYPTNPLFYCPPEPDYLPCSLEESAKLNLITLKDRSTAEEWTRHHDYILTLNGDHAAQLEYACQQLTALDAADDAQMYRDLREGRY